MRRLLPLVSSTVLVLVALTLAPGALAADADACGSRSQRDCEPTPLSAEVTAQGQVARAYSWGVEKAADATVRSTTSSGQATFRYVVTARAGAMTESGWTLGGEVTVTNPDTEDAVTADVGVATSLGGGSSCTVVGGQGAVVPAADQEAGQVTLPYTCAFTSAPAASGSVTTTVAWDPTGEDADAFVEASAPASFAVVSETNRTVAVVDDRTVPGQRVVLDPALTWAPGLVRTYAYDLALAGGAPGVCRSHLNTATIDQPTGTDPSASVGVRACTPEVLPAQAYGRATGSVSAGCQGTVRARVSNRTAEKVTYTLRVGHRLHRIVVRSMGHRKFVTSGPAMAKVTLKVEGARLDRIRIPQRCQPPTVLPDTGLRVTGS